jgi:hypothetical protein
MLEAHRPPPTHVSLEIFGALLRPHLRNLSEK